MSSPFRSEELVVLDGGLSNALKKYVTFDIDSEPLWTAKALLDAPEAIVKTHLDYLKAGADIISTCSYQATIPGFIKYQNLNQCQGEELIKKSVQLASQAIEEYLPSSDRYRQGHRRPLVAGSVGPYGAFLCDRSEYTGKYMDDLGREELSKFHVPRLRVLLQAGIDLLLVETMPSIREVEIVLEMLHQFPRVPILLSFSVTSGSQGLTTAYGDSLRSIMELVQKYSNIIGFGINCCHPQLVQNFLQESSTIAQTISGFDIQKYKRIVYPNPGNYSCDAGGWSDQEAFSIDTYVKPWLTSGATIIGGCCEVGPVQIQHVRRMVDSIQKFEILTRNRCQTVYTSR